MNEGSRELALQDLLAADTILPEQFWGRTDGAMNRSGERALMWAVLTDGIEAYRRNVGAVSSRERAEFIEAERWVFSTNWEWPFSFVNLCEAFGFNPAGVRRALRGLRNRRSRHEMQRQRFRPVTLRAA